MAGKLKPGTGKTTTPEVVGQILFGLTLDEIQKATHYCNPQLTEEKLIGGYHLPKLLNGEKEVVWGHWVESFYRMLDEANRMAPETSAIFLQALDRRQASYAGEVKDMPFGPVFATANPFDSGNFEMTPPFLDRFGVSVFTTGINAGFLDSIFSPSDQIDRASHALSLEERMRIYGEIQSIGIRNETLRFLSYLAGGLTSCQGPKGLGYQDHDKSLLPNNKPAFEFCGEACNFEYGRVVCSQIKERSLGRGILALRDYGRALAWLMGKTEIDNEIMFWTFQMVMGHRLNPSKIAMDGGESPLGPDIDKKNLFTSKTWYFVKHLWELGRGSYLAQESVLNQYYGFFENMEGSSVSQIKAESENILKAVDAMTDPAKWGMLIAIRSVRKAIEGLGG